MCWGYSMKIKKKKKAIIIVNLIVLIIFGIYLMLIIKSNEVEQFNIQEFEEFIETFPVSEVFSEDRVVGTVNNSNEAKEKAKLIWREVFNEEMVKKCKRYKVGFDKKSKIWSVRAYSQNFILYILITQEDGKIIAVWGGK